MSLWKRVCLGILRRPVQSSAIFIAVLLMSIAFVFGSFVKDIIASFYNQFELLQGFSIYVENRTETGVEKIDDSVLKVLRENKHIVGLNRTSETECTPLDFENVPYKSQKGLSIAELTDQITLIGNMDTSFYGTFRNDFMILTEGSYPSEAIQGILIDETLAKYNNLSLDSYVSIYSKETGKSSKVKIVGIYETLQSPRKEVNSNIGTSFFVESSSYVFCDLTTYGLVGNIETMQHLLNIYIDKRDNVDKVRNYLLSSSMFSKQSLIASALENELSGNSLVISTLKSSADSILLITFITSIGIIFLLTLLWMKKHTYETGIYLALGTPKYKIVVTFLYEIFLICICAIVAAIFIGGSVLGENSKVVYDMVLGRNGMYITNHLLEQDVIADSFSVETLIKSAIISLSVAILATLLASIEIVNYKPRNLLSDK